MAWNGLTILNALADGPRLTRQIAAVLGKPSRDVSGCLRALRSRGFIISAEGVHQITEDGREALAAGVVLTSGPCNGNTMSRQSNTLRAKAWRAMRMRDGFSLDDLLTMLCDGSEAQAEDNLRTYISALEAAGYLMRLPKRGKDTPRRWRLKRDHDTGLKAPAWHKATRTLTDHNTGKVFVVARKRSLKQEASHAA